MSGTVRKIVVAGKLLWAIIGWTMLARVNGYILAALELVLL